MGRNVIRQIPEKDYSLQECLDLLLVPAHLRASIQGFGNRLWVNQAPVPEIWVCKALRLDSVTNKIRLIMKAWAVRLS